jgi:hypothetical protein
VVAVSSDHIHAPSPSPFTPVPLGPSRTGPVLHSCPPLFKCVFTAQRGFTWVFQLCICCTLISLTPYPFPPTPYGTTALGASLVPSSNPDGTCVNISTWLGDGLLFKPSLSFLVAQPVPSVISLCWRVWLFPTGESTSHLAAT